ncbi:hypothetical protein ACLOJK_038116 [Asimina triloba]
MSDEEQGAPPPVVGSSSSRSELVEEFAIVAGLVVVQIIYAVYAVVASHLLSLGLSALFLVIYGTLATSALLFPFAVCLERTPPHRLLQQCQTLLRASSLSLLGV